MIGGSALPRFDERGLLPPGDYELTLDALEGCYLVTGEGMKTAWDVPWRLKLVSNLRIVVGQLVSVGITEIYVDGSFVEDKPHPGDIDGYFTLKDLAGFRSGRLEGSLNALDPYRAWTWAPSRRTYHIKTGQKKLPLWHRYRVDMWPHDPTLYAGIMDLNGNQLRFPAAFRMRKDDDAPKGIVRIGGLS